MTPESQYRALQRYSDQVDADELERAEQVGELAAVTPIRSGVPAPKPRTSIERIHAGNVDYLRRDWLKDHDWRFVDVSLRKRPGTAKAARRPARVGDGAA